MRRTRLVAAGSACAPGVTLAIIGTPLAGVAATKMAVASGSVINSDGTAAGGVPIVLLAQPTSAQLDALPEGASINVAVVGGTTTAADGSYVLSVTNAAPLASLTNPAGDVSFEVRSLDPKTPLATDNISAHWDKTTSTITQATGGSTIGAAQPAAIKTYTYSGVSHVATARARALTTVTPQDNPTKCYDVVGKTIGDEAASIARYYSRASGVSAYMEYNVEASSTLGIGVSATISSAVSASGSSETTKTNGTDETSGKQSGSFNRAANGKFRYKQFHDYCEDSHGNVSASSYQDRATSWQSGLHDVDLGGAPTFPTSNDYCIPRDKNSIWSLKSSTASTLAGGVDLTGPFGIKVDARSGYTTTAALHMDFTSTAGRVCGQKDKPSDTPGLLVARNAL